MRYIRFIATVIVLMLVLSSCQPTPIIPPVANKNDGKLESVLYKEAPKGYIYDVPETVSYNETYLNGRMTVTCDNVDVKIASNTSFPIYEATIKSFSADELKMYIETLFGDDCELYEHNTQLTKDEITSQYLVPLQKKRFEVENDEYNLENYYRIMSEGEHPRTKNELKKDLLDSIDIKIALLKAKIADAPDSIEKNSIKINKYKPGSEFNIDISCDKKSGQLYVDKTGMEIQVSFGKYEIIDNQRDLVIPKLENDPDYETYFKVKMSEADAIQAATEFVEDIGLFSGYAYSGTGWQSFFKLNPEFNNFLELYAGEGDDDAYEFISCYGVVFTQSINGFTMPTFYGYTNANGVRQIGSHENFGKPFLYNALIVWVNDSGVCGFVQKGRLDTALISSGAELIEFDELFDGAMKQVYYCHDSYTGIYDAYQDIDAIDLVSENNIFGVEFTYYQMKKKETDDRFLLLPVLCIYNDQTDKYHYKGKEEIRKGFTEITLLPYVIMNALDGSTIDYGLGY